MTYTVSITSQGQISIPVKIRRELGINKNSTALLTVHEGDIVITPTKDLLDLKGSIKTNKKPLSDDELHELFAEELAKEADNRSK